MMQKAQRKFDLVALSRQVHNFSSEICRGINRVISLKKANLTGKLFLFRFFAKKFIADSRVPSGTR